MSSETNREKLLSMVKGEKNRKSLIYHLRFGQDREPDPFEVDQDEIDELSPDSDFLFLFGTNPQDRDEIVRENRCLIRQEDGSFKAHNTDREGPSFLVL